MQPWRYHYLTGRVDSFFVHLTEVLGGTEFLAPVSMLLIEKVTGRVVRQSQSDAQTSLSIPLSILHHYGSATQVEVRSSWLFSRTQNNYLHQTLKDIVQESGRVLAHAFKLEITEPTFLDLTRYVVRQSHGQNPDRLQTQRNDEDGSSIIAAKRRSHALLLFVNYALQQTRAPAEGRVSGIVPLLLQISVVASAHSNEKQAMEIDSAARNCLSSVLSIVPAVEFVSCATTLVTEVGDTRVSVTRKTPPGESSDRHPR